MKKNQENQMVTQLLEFDEQALAFQNNISEVEVLRTGEWDHPSYGKMVITQETLDEMIKNFNARLRKGVYFTEGHPVDDEELPSVGWVTGLRKLGESLRAVVEWTEDGMEMLRKKSYKFFSPEFYFKYEDPESRETYKNVLTGGALTNRPYFKSLEAVVLSEKMLTRNKKAMKFNLEEVLAKKAEDVSSEERAFLLTMKEDLDESDVKKFELSELKAGDSCTKCGKGTMKKSGDMLECSSCGTKKKMSESSAEETEEEKAAREAQEKADAEKKAAEEAEVAKKAEEEAARSKEGEGEDKKVEMSEKAVKGMEAELEKTKKELSELKMKETKASIASSLDKFKFSEDKKEGILLPKTVEKAQSFAESLNEDQRKQFFEIMEEMPKKQMFGEIGKGGEFSINMDQKPVGVSDESWTLDQTAKQIQNSEKKADGSAYSYEEAVMLAEKRTK